ncbi:MAG TPA: D-alanine--D-alanine ligase, partial [Brevibacterium sp.]|nr:D-alanine--D-alanine ligase [Brevibacterium sp.]
IPTELEAECRALGVAAHEALGCRGMSRSDILIDADGVPWVIETNTIPGMTPVSLLPDAAKSVGIEWGPLCRMVVELALE